MNKSKLIILSNKIELELHKDYDCGCNFPVQSKKIGAILLSQLKKEVASINAEVASFNKGFGFFSCFVKRNQHYIYINIEDYRDGARRILNDILYRTAKDIKDYTGGSNCYTDIDNLAIALDKMFNEMENK